MLCAVQINGNELRAPKLPPMGRGRSGAPGEGIKLSVLYQRNNPSP